MYQTLVDNFNFEEKEAKVYLAALQLGRSRVSLIAKKAELNRITTYEILKRLVQKGFAYSAMYGGILTFNVVEPQILFEKMESKMHLAKNILPQLVALSSIMKQKPNISHYEGVEGIRSIYEDTLSCKDKFFWNIVSPENLIKTIGQDFFQEYLKKRVRRKIKIKALLPDIPENKKYQQQKTALRHIKFFNNDLYKISNEIIIYDNKVALFSFTSLIGVIIEDTDIAQSLRMMCQMIWDEIK